MAKVASETLVYIDDNFRIDTDGTHNYTVMVRKKIDMNHHKARQDNGKYRWETAGYYGTFRGACEALMNKMTLHYGHTDGGHDVKSLSEEFAKYAAAIKKAIRQYGEK